MDERVGKIDSRPYAAVYYFHINGGLTASDLLNSLANDPDAIIPKSSLLKESLLDIVRADESDLDSEVRAALKSAIEKLEPRLDAEFYGLAETAPQSD